MDWQDRSALVLGLDFTRAQGRTCHTHCQRVQTQLQLAHC